MKKMLFFVALMSITALNAVDSEEVTRGCFGNQFSQSNGCPCNPCVPNALVSGTFATDSMGNPINKQGCAFTVSMSTTPMQYIITILRPFCGPLAVAATRSGATTASGAVSVISTTGNTITLGNIPMGESLVAFTGGPTSGNGTLGL